MKKSVLLLSLLILAVSLFGQNIPRGANVIVLKTNYTTLDEAMVIVPRKLLSSGISIATINEKIGYLNTGSFFLKGVSNQATIFFEQTDSVIYAKLSGTFITGLEVRIGAANVASKAESTTFAGMKGSPVRNAWEALEKIAQLIDHSSIYFTIDGERVDDGKKGKGARYNDDFEDSIYSK